MDAQLNLLAREVVPLAPRSAGRARLLTWNVQHASARRSAAQAAWLAGTDADVMILTEVSPAHDAIEQTLSEYGFTTFTPVPAAGSAGDYRVTLACRAGTVTTWTDPLPAHLPHRCALARVRFDTAPPGTDGDTPGGSERLTVAGLYVPSRGPRQRRNVDKRAFQDAVAAWLPVLAERRTGVPVVIAGDLNVVEPAHVPHHEVFGAWEYGFYRCFGEHGFTDAYRHLHPRDVDHSWFGRRSGAGYRFDHLFIDRAHATGVHACDYDHAPRHAGLSDHSALRADITLAPDQALTAPTVPALG